MKKEMRENLSFIRRKIQGIHEIHFDDRSKHYKLTLHILGVEKPIRMTVASTTGDYRSRQALVTQVKKEIRKAKGY